MPRSSPTSMRWSGKGRRRRLRIGRPASTTSGYCHVRKPRLVYGIGGPLLLITPSNWLTNRHRRADRRDSVLIEAFDRHPIRLADRECSELERRPLVGEALVGLIQLCGRDSPAHVVADDSRHSLPPDYCVAFIAIAACGQVRG